MTDSKLNFQGIYHTFRDKIHRYLIRLVGVYEAEDLTQEVFIKVKRGLQNFRGDSKLSTWIYRIATHAALDRMRSPSFQRIVLEKGSENLTEKGIMETEDKDVWTGEKSLTTEQQYIQQEMNACIRDFIESLSQNYKTVLILSELEGLKNKEIAEILHISLDAVKIRLHRARLRLKQKLEMDCSFYHNEQNELSCDLKDEFEEFRKVH